ncbi:hypothetical protein PGT21_001271 [Puccinia graminis f. sp. tritici]|uniref:Uncharacterized protein n=1 Tax=Puccinia graminis f. sp. tritici TaxID=56615 RepID=A0A5B0QE69_PUCGR|nr:hypothetical protein PGT21_001271 [Puccinia graminis f. sp. tritici]
MVNGLLLWRDYSNLRHGHGGKHGVYGEQQQQQQAAEKPQTLPQRLLFFGWWYLANHMDHHECENPSGMPATDIEESYDQGTPS